MIDWKYILELYADRPLFLTGKEAVSYQAFHTLLKKQQSTVPDSSISCIALEWNAQSFASMLGTLESGGSVILDRDISRPSLDQFSEDMPIVVLRSGGSTGSPRHVAHAWESFISPYRVKRRNNQTWMILYSAEHIAGLDAFLHLLHRGATVAIPDATSVDGIGTTIEQNKVDVITSTPSSLQFQLLGGLSEDHDLSSVKWILHGAERMSPQLRHKISKAFPNAHTANRFGTTETGALPVRADPYDRDALFLNAPGYEWKLLDDEIYIKAPTSFLGYLEEGKKQLESGWYPTGDIGELTERGSMRVLGRKGSVINVGGMKIGAEVVEQMLLEVPEILDVVAYPVSHSVTGQAVAANVVARGSISASNLKKLLIRRVTESGHSLAMVPVRINLVEKIHTTDFGKRKRVAECLDPGS